MIFESHAHYDDKRFDHDRIQLLSSMQENGIGTIINVGADIETTKKTIELTRQYDFIYGAVGVHPSEIDCLDDTAYEWLGVQCDMDKIVAVGEIGLDYYWEKESAKQEQQKFWFRKLLHLAKEKNLPVIIHSRDAAEATIELMKQEQTEKIEGVIHCFSYSKEMALEYVKMGYYIGIGGVITFSNAKKLKEAVKEIPINRILLETDCPYLAPDPNRGKRNSSLNLIYIAQKIAEIKDMKVEEVVDATTHNAQKLFHIQ